MDQSIPSSRKTSKTENDSFEKKGPSDCENAQSSDVSSLYEINVHENFSSESNSSKGSSHFYVRPKLMIKVKKIGGNKEVKENNHDNHSFVKNLKKIANPLIESYYPFLEDHQIGNINIEVNVSPVNPDGKESGKNSVEEKNSENSNSSWDKSSESITSNNQKTKEGKKLAINSFDKMKKKIKRQIIQNMLTRKDDEFKDVEWKDVEEDQFHIHHHEHHHHYYMDAAKMKDESEFSLLQDGPHSPVHWSEDKNKAGILSAEFDVKKRERPNYLCDCSHQHPVNFLMGKDSRNLSKLTFVKSSKEEYLKIAEKYSSRIPLFKPLKKGSSMDSFNRKKSDLIVFHNYSDTGVSKCDSEESSFTDVPSSRSAFNVSRNMAKSAKTEHKSCANSKLWGERDFITGSVIEVDELNCSVFKKSSDEKCEKISTEMKENNKKSGNPSDLFERLKTSEKKDEDRKGEFEILVSKKTKTSDDELKKGRRNYFMRPVCTLSSEGEPVDMITDTGTSDENVKSTSTITSSRKDTATVVEISEDGSSRTLQKCSRSNTPKSAGNSEDKMRSFSKKKINNNDKVTLKSKQTFGILGNSHSKGVVHCYYSCRRNGECNITLMFEKNRKRAAESSKSSDSGNKKRKERSSAKSTTLGSLSFNLKGVMKSQPYNC